MDLIIALIVIFLAWQVIVALKISLWTLLIVVLIVALVIWIMRNARAQTWR
jgi:Ca2+/Na+ antiporter